MFGSSWDGFEIICQSLRVTVAYYKLFNETIPYNDINTTSTDCFFFLASISRLNLEVDHAETNIDLSDFNVEARANCIWPLPLSGKSTLS